MAITALHTQPQAAGKPDLSDTSMLFNTLRDLSTPSLAERFGLPAMPKRLGKQFSIRRFTMAQGNPTGIKVVQVFAANSKRGDKPLLEIRNDNGNYERNSTATASDLSALGAAIERQQQPWWKRVFSPTR